eukprot:scaffold135023_cov17-Cyclotella_meneghiniana.AAC.1
MSLLLRPTLLRRITHLPCYYQSVKTFSSALPSSSLDDGTDQSLTKFFNPTDEHSGLREMVRSFAEREVRQSFHSI